MELFGALIGGVSIGAVIGIVFSGLLSSASFDDRCSECLEYRKILEKENEQTTKEKTN